MNFRYLKILMVGLTLVFAAQGCMAVVRDDGHRRYRDWDHPHGYKHGHSSIQQLHQSPVQMTTRNSGDSLFMNK